MYKVVPLTKDLRHLQQQFSEMYPGFPLRYFWEDLFIGRQRQKLRIKCDIWVNDMIDWYIEPIKGNPELYKFMNDSFPIQCQKQYRGQVERYIYPRFIELDNVNCPWIRGGEYDLLFSDKDKFLTYFKEEFFLYSSWTGNWVDYKEEYTWFADNFVNGINLIRLG
jgi:hypothetical protein